jgi:hypothetical protein
MIAADFGFSDPNDAPPNNFLAVKIATPPAAGLLLNNSVSVTAGQTVLVSQIVAGSLRYIPAANANGADNQPSLQETIAAEFRAAFSPGERAVT